MKILQIFYLKINFFRQQLRKKTKQFEPLQTQIDSYNTKIRLQTQLNPSELLNCVKLWKEEMWSQQSAIFTIFIVQKVLDIIISLTKTWL